MPSPDVNLVSVATQLADIQHGVVARRQLMVRGIPSPAINGRVRTGYLTPIFRGIYAVGRREVSQRGLWMAAVLASGNGAALGYRSAAAAWGVLSPRRSVDTIRRSTNVSRRRGEVFLEGEVVSVPLMIRSTGIFPESDLAVVAGIPVTSIERTLLDLAFGSRTQFRKAFLEADRLDLLSDLRLARCAARNTPRNGAGAFRQMVENRIDCVGRSKSILEAFFLHVCLEAEIEFPEVNTYIDGFQVDCVWQEARLAVELDSRGYHHGRESFEHDAVRDNHLRSTGWRLLRFTYRMVTRDPNRTATQVKAGLAESRRGSEVSMK